ncbi:MAG: TldD/PmbA family protein [Candidatus Heimdallarchaeota archaeon]|nr:MAG: TldD/PmbA family protein [Candidatus Heimdallarchaeota archaeon]
MSVSGQELCDKAIDLALQKGATYVEARFESLQNNQFVLKNGVPELGAFDRTKGLGIRVLVDGAMGFGSFNTLNRNSMNEAITQAIKLAKASSRVRKHPITFSEEKAYEKKYAAKVVQSPSDTDPEEKMKILFEIDKNISDLPIPFRIVILIDTISHRYYVNSDGARIEDDIPRILFYGLLTAVDQIKGAMEQAYFQKGATGGYEWIEKWDIVNFLKKEAEILTRVASESKKSPKGKIDFVAGPNIAGIIAHENCGHPSEADRILGREAAQAGESYLGLDKLGKKIGSDYVTIIDDPTISGSYGYYLYDAEGIPGKPRYLIKNGIFKEMLHNRESAGFLNTQSTGAARVSAFNREPIPRMANTFIAAGDYDFDEILEDIKLGIYIKNHSEWNIDDRRFQSKYVGREAYLIRDGELTNELIRRPVLETTTPDLFSSIDAASKKLEFDAATCGKGDPVQGTPVWHGGPKATRIRNILVR